jgi:hypothetical protein
VWFEAEPPNGEANALLSGGHMSWVAPAGSVQKTVTIPAEGTYTLWVRKFWNGQTFRWRVGTADAWKTTANPPLQDLVDLGPGRKVGWINAGSVTLTAGTKAFADRSHRCLQHHRLRLLPASPRKLHPARQTEARRQARR